ncbi:MAG TPA: peptidyl-tRNA hydrolase [Candidatus Korarchaeota archaeon]|nr:MAG: peptidyl-tRNA hydrolase [Candidatus Korarchaeota archaeon]HDD68903.1 peptidyl-tRNA hydrolase [Candidatus Korarchaeota archaeon]
MKARGRCFRYKQVIVVRGDIEMSRGKIAAQVAHAACEAFENARKMVPDIWRAWREEGSKKVVLVAGEKELLEIYEKAGLLGIPRALIRDAGLTELPPGTLTAVAIGPYYDEEIDKITRNLRPLK